MPDLAIEKLENHNKLICPICGKNNIDQIGDGVFRQNYDKDFDEITNYNDKNIKTKRFNIKLCKDCGCHFSIVTLPNEKGYINL